MDKWIIRTPKAEVNLDEISAVWCRRSSVYLNSLQQNDRSNGFRIWRSEWNKTLFGIYSALRGVFWMNRLYESALCDNKFFQFKIASQCDLNIPEFITSNDRINLLNFSNNNSKCALKFMAQDMYESPSGSPLGLYVNIINKDDLNSFMDKSENPITVQKYINKSFEVRYTFVDGDHFLCKIDSQKSSRASTDWRRYDIPNTPHIAMEKNTVISYKVDDLMKKLNLSFGALDFAVDIDGKWWFLEVNSAGQWLWIEDLSGLQISESITKCLIRESRKVT